MQEYTYYIVNFWPLVWEREVQGSNYDAYVLWNTLIKMVVFRWKYKWINIQFIENNGVKMDSH